MADNDSQKFLRGVMGFNGIVDVVPSNTPSQYTDRKTQYMAGRAKKFDHARAYLSTDYVEALVQGISSNDFYEWTNTDIRLSDVSKNPKNSLNGQKNDDRKIVLFSDESIDYIPIGAKIETMGSTWIVINPNNLSSAKTTCIVARCNASYNSYDEYGNIVTEPIVVESYQMDNNDNKSVSQMVLMGGYFKVICQLNTNTAKLHENSRIILGTKAYHITGLADFTQEFSGDRESCHYLTFNIRVEEPTELDDITTNFIAGGNGVSFGVTVAGVNEIALGNSTALSASFVVNGKADYDTPRTWLWTSSDDTVAKVDTFGGVSAVSIGTCDITVTLEQNPNLSAVFKLVITDDKTESVAFMGDIPSSISQYSSAIIYAAFFKGGEIEADTPIQWTFSNAEPYSYSTEISSDGRRATISCLRASSTPLRVTIAANDAQPKYADIELEGY